MKVSTCCIACQGAFSRNSGYDILFDIVLLSVCAEAEGMESPKADIISRICDRANRRIIIAVEPVWI